MNDKEGLEQREPRILYHEQRLVGRGLVGRGLVALPVLLVLMIFGHQGAWLTFVTCLVFSPLVAFVWIALRWYSRWDEAFRVRGHLTWRFAVFFAGMVSIVLPAGLLFFWAVGVQ